MLLVLLLAKTVSCSVSEAHCEHTLSPLLRAQADQFAQCCTYMFYCWVFYMSVWPLLKAKFGCSAGVNAGVNAGVKL